MGALSRVKRVFLGREIYMSSMISKFNIQVQECAILGVALLLLTACGSTSATGSTTGGSSVLATATATPNPTATPGNIYDLPDAPIYDAQINGAGGAVPSVSYSIQTSRTLNVMITPQPAPNLTLAGYTNWVFPYGCLSLSVTVNGQTQYTGVMQVAGVTQAANSVCANAPTSQVLNFSNDINGNGPTSVKVSNADYDNCRYTNPMIYGCGMSAIFQNHIVSALVQIQGDGTYMGN